MPMTPPPPVSAFCHRLRSGATLLGTILTLPSPELAEVLADAGFDWLFLDLEHGLLDVPEAQRVLQAVGHRCPGLIRVPACEEVWIKRALDIGPAGLIIPRVTSAAEAARAVAWAKYPPAGERGVGAARAQGYGYGLREYLARANDETAVIIQIEDRRAVAEVGAILDLPGVDAAFIGPFDLSASLGVAGDLTAPPLLAAIATVEEAARARHKPVGIFYPGAEGIRQARARGHRLLVVGTDAIFAGAAAREAIAAVQRP
jgi:2-keto-3-deoxy-L-rhamnonate aldolase RhmA